jgi:AraC-like DNA-binding protein
LLTASDVARARVDWGKRDTLRDAIAEQVWSQVLTGTVSIESAAHSLDTSVRTLQRELNREGISFRDLANELRAKRAMELLRDTRMSVTEISAELGYSAPAHFARAFRKAVGISPHEFQRHHPPKISA